MDSKFAYRARQRFFRFIEEESAGGLVMLAAALLAMVAANSLFAAQYEQLVHAPITLGWGALQITEPLHIWVNDVGMVLFFFIVGMELKRELCEGVLVDKRQVVLPMMAALGGMVVPAFIYMAINRGMPEHAQGWAIPMATDIAFALAVLLLAAKNAPPALKIFLLAIAIFDDLGAILVIAFFYSHGVAWLPLLVAAGAILVLAMLHRQKVRSLWLYLVVGAALCVALYHGGVHATIGGVITGLLIPMRDKKNDDYSPLNRCMHALHPWVSFGVLPVFAFTAAGVAVETEHLPLLLAPLSLGIILGLFVGKQLGIFGATWLLVKTRLVTLPQDTGWRHIYAVSVIAGIGFTMSLFIGNLAFEHAALLAQAKLGVILASVLSAVVGWLVLRSVLRP
jgi:NhaA family Na+:H+ antiporter